jgi:hypothetical protein
MKVYLLTTGTDRDGDAWCVEAICATPEAWERAKAAHIAERGYDHTNPIDQWEVEE